MSVKAVNRGAVNAEEMRLRPAWAAAGAIVGICVVAGIGVTVSLSVGPNLGFPFLRRFASASAVWNLGAYAATAYCARDRHRTTLLGELGRGALIGTNAAMNGLIAFVVLGAPLRLAGVVACLLALLPLGSLWPAVARSRWYHRCAGWGTSLLPMSWPVQVLGLLFLAGSALLWVVSLGGVRLLRLLGVRVDWETGSFFVRGGIAANANYLRTAFNMGGFSFVHLDSRAWHLAHEAGHTLCLTAFGSVFHLAGALDENIWPRRGAMAYAERVAHSNVARHGPTTIPMWRPAP